MKKRTLWILGAIVLVAIPTSYFAYAATLGVNSSKVTVHRQGATIAVPSPTPSLPPTPSASPSAPTAKTCTLVAIADATINERNSTTATGGDLAVRSERSRNKRALVRFDVASCAIPTGATVTSATMRLTTATAPVAPRTYVVSPATSSWTEAVTWDTKPTFGSTSGTSASGLAGSVLSWTVTNDVKGYVTTPASNFGWQVSDSAEGSASPSPAYEGIFRSRDFGTVTARPTLVINYTS